MEAQIVEPIFNGRLRERITNQSSLYRSRLKKKRRARFVVEIATAVAILAALTLVIPLPWSLASIFSIILALAIVIVGISGWIHADLRSRCEKMEYDFFLLYHQDIQRIVNNDRTSSGEN